MAAAILAKERGLTVLSTTRRPEGAARCRRSASTTRSSTTASRRRVRGIVPDGVDARSSSSAHRRCPTRCAPTRVHGVVCFTGMLSNEWIGPDFYPIGYLPQGRPAHRLRRRRDRPPRRRTAGLPRRRRRRPARVPIDRIYALRRDRQGPRRHGGRQRRRQARVGVLDSLGDRTRPRRAAAASGARVQRGHRLVERRRPARRCVAMRRAANPDAARRSWRSSQRPEEGRCLPARRWSWASRPSPRSRRSPSRPSAPRPRSGRRSTTPGSRTAPSRRRAPQPRARSGAPIRSPIAPEMPKPRPPLAQLMNPSGVRARIRRWSSGLAEGVSSTSTTSAGRRSASAAST